MRSTPTDPDVVTTSQVGARGRRWSGFAHLLRTPAFARLLAVRLSAQWADGLFQAALGGAVLFNPEREADPLLIASGLAVMLLPYSLLGPFAGALLDRWDRRRVLAGASVLRALLVACVAGALALGLAGPALFVLALAVTGVNRFVLSGLSAALPHVVDERSRLVPANTLSVTVGASMSALGAASAIGFRAVFGADDAGSALTTLTAAGGSLLAAALAIGFTRAALGPDPADPEFVSGHRRSDSDIRAREAGLWRTIAGGLVAGARATTTTPAVAAPFLGLVAHRLAFGINTLLMLMLFRYTFTAEQTSGAGGLLGVGQIVLLTAAGLGAAALLTPWLVRRVGAVVAVRVGLAGAATSQLLVAAFLTLPVVLVTAFLLGVCGQVVKLCADAGVQGGASDDVRGRVFALFDAVFNVCYVLAITFTALVGPADGRSPALLAVAGGIYLAGLAAHVVYLRGRRSLDREPV
ncbi:MFS transporter [Pseudonocardia sediminis]|uniref:MFS transporter n=1 Tax=Pseudonocardia sediminis TaxID=1397368 RepID=A0A4Q7UR47_PSEST|nr:MFS transporter [Pseudonocardia sediminis]RZT83208.1 MFS transporter [Pseudonocardia sediminis]